MDGEVSSSGAKSSVTRTLFYLGFPLNGYNLKADNVTDQLDKIEEFEVDPVSYTHLTLPTKLSV